ncbi:MULTISPECIES: tRNA dihydrouridine(20/20a) synthase DusA [unclassified Wenzhouxiangella]|uniref:tRNA dihydrouridine(20/20a) synthase DusA n=1 Tax=unclassified Wenzhouxiangella TaxID=2613841 RepID=UPI000E32BEEA|nr:MULTISPECIES: tRNA dihydrouridine(20/20a) synthase DusA [unclassified Wenzhouxiangella]RFF26624.1 tRNA dihydrouridine(20/20a) synthase DusA [Wenzhouxiangella sp. 15181]RFP67626.1 tRNA dihydrouridine(20/20a) synthase DusA [Wenzhouxiangella sp. 15190]
MPRPETLSVAPMMDWTDRHCRYFHRLLAPRVLLYTEMVTTGAVIHGDRERLLGFDPAEHPVALQLGGSDPEELARAARAGAEFGYDEINLNVGCPSDRVQKGRFGACLMKEPGLVRDCLAAMREAVEIPVTVKTRIGVDECESEGFFFEFVDTVAESGISTVIVHARKAWLSGLSPKENREVPPLIHERVHALKARNPELNILINGGITEIDDALEHLEYVDGVMLGRAAYQNPWILAQLSRELGWPAARSREAVVEAMVDYARRHIEAGGRLNHVARHMLGLFHGQPGARYWRRHLSQNMHSDGADTGLLLEAMSASTGPWAAAG